MKLAVIDIGSNAIRLGISRVIPRDDNKVHFKKIEFIRIPLRLGDDVFKNGKIGKEKQRLFAMSMQAFKLIMDVHEVKYYKACATSAMRDAENAQAILEKAQKKSNLHIELISGDRESRLILKAVSNLFLHNGDFLNIDVGGGSTEITLVHEHKPVFSRSFDIGAVRSRMNKVAPETSREMETWVTKHVKKLINPVAFGTGGNINRLCRILGAEEGKTIGLADLRNLVERISRMDIHKRIFSLQMNPDRADIIDHAGNIYINVMQWAGIDKLIAPNTGLKEGLLIELWEELQQNRVKL